MSANNSIAATVAQGDPDCIEDLSDNLEALIVRASSRIAKRVGEMVDEGVQKSVTRRDGTKVFVPIPGAELYGSSPDGPALVRDTIREILMEDLYLSIMMPK